MILINYDWLITCLYHSQSESIPSDMVGILVFNFITPCLTDSPSPASLPGMGWKNGGLCAAMWGSNPMSHIGLGHSKVSRCRMGAMGQPRSQGITTSIEDSPGSLKSSVNRELFHPEFQLPKVQGDVIWAYLGYIHEISPIMSSLRVTAVSQQRQRWMPLTSCYRGQLKVETVYISLPTQLLGGKKLQNHNFKTYPKLTCAYSTFVFPSIWRLRCFSTWPRNAPHLCTLRRCQGLLCRAFWTTWWLLITASRKKSGSRKPELVLSGQLSASEIFKNGAEQWRNNGGMEWSRTIKINNHPIPSHSIPFPFCFGGGPPKSGTYFSTPGPLGAPGSWEASAMKFWAVVRPWGAFTLTWTSQRRRDVKVSNWEMVPQKHWTHLDTNLVQDG